MENIEQDLRTLRSFYPYLKDYDRKFRELRELIEQEEFYRMIKENKYASRHSEIHTNTFQSLEESEVPMTAAQAIPDQGNWPTCDIDESHGPSEWKCLHCEDHMCSSCTSIHRKGKRTREHRLLHRDSKCEEQKVMKELFCSIHKGIQLDRYCKKDKKSICVECYVVSHLDHEVITIDAQNLENMTRLGESMVTIERKMQACEKVIKRMDEYFKKAEKVSRQNCKVIDSVTERVISTINDRSSAMTKTEQNEMDTLKDSINNRIANLKEMKQKMKKEALETRRFLETCNNKTLKDEASHYLERLSFKKHDGRDITVENIRNKLASKEIEKTLMI